MGAFAVRKYLEHSFHLYVRVCVCVCCAPNILKWCSVTNHIHCICGPALGVAECGTRHAAHGGTNWGVGGARQIAQSSSAPSVGVRAVSYVHRIGRVRAQFV